jgi:histidinol-phosphate aminotransferase
LIAQRYDVALDLIQVFNGAEHVLKLAFAAVARMREATLLLPTPGWKHYDLLANRYGLSTQRYAYRADGDAFTIDLDSLNAQIRRTARPVLLLASPTNPLGARLTESVLRDLAELVAPKGHMIVDQTYAGYAGPANLDWSIGELLRLLPRVLIVRSLSKYYGLPGLRVGFTAALPEVHQAFGIFHDYLGFNAFSDAFAAECLRRHSEFEAIATEIEALRWKLTAAIARAPGFTPFQSHANFLLVRSPSNSYATWLADAGIRVRQFATDELHDCVRITIPPLSAVRRIEAATKQFIGR